MELTLDGNKYIATTKYEERALPKGAGFRWNPADKHWWTDDVKKAARLADHATGEVKAALEQIKVDHVDTVAAGRATDWAGEIVAPEGLDYLPCRKAGIKFAMGRDGVLFGDEMGLGKTIQAIGVMNTMENLKRVLIVAPATLRLNWKREIEKWLVHNMTIQVVNGGKAVDLDGDIVIINYDVCTKHEAALKAITWDLLIADEAHYMKNGIAKRTTAILGKWNRDPLKVVAPIQATKKIFLTGTPIPNRPIEAWTLVNALDHENFKNRGYFAKRYANGHHNGWGWDETGAANLDELQDKMRGTILVRRLKDEVLKDLPAKIRQVIEIEGDNVIEKAEKAVTDANENFLQLKAAAEIAAVDGGDEYKNAVQKLGEAEGVTFEKMAAARRDTAIAKVPYIIEHLKDVMEDGRKVVLFAHHKEVIKQIVEGYDGEAVTITGDTPMAARQDAVDRFQNDPTIKLFVGNIQAAGVGITLTAANTVIFAELDWVPGNVTQAEDRCHRIGQKNFVQVQHIVLEGTIDAHLARTLLAKQAILDQALDNDNDFDAFAAPEVKVQEEKTKTAKQVALQKVAANLTPKQIDVIHTALRQIADQDQDRARVVNGVGFNKFDGHIGHQLAGLETLTPGQAALGQKIVTKYRRQLDPELVEELIG